MGQRYPIMEAQNPGHGLACNLDFAKEEGLEAKVKKASKIVQIGRRGEQTSLTQTYHRRGFGGGAAVGQFFINFFGKNSYFNAVWITFGMFLEPFEKTKLGKPIEKIKLFCFLCTYRSSPKHDKNLASLS